MAWNNTSANTALKRVSKFVDQTLSGETKKKESKFLQITTKGEIIEDLRKDHYKVLEWKNVGIKHNVIKKVCLCIPSSDNNNKFTKSFFLYVILSLVTLVLINLL